MVTSATLLTLSPAFAQTVDSVNSSSTPANPFILFTQDLGWLYTPETSYLMNGVQTRFGISPRADYNRTVTLEIYSDLPASGGILLRATSFTPIADGFAGGSFADLPIIAGDAFFVGFRNVLSLGGNITSQIDAANLGAAYTSDDQSYSMVTTGGFLPQPILRFEYVIPEPGSSFLLSLGAASVLGFRSRRKRSEPAPRVAATNVAGQIHPQ